MLPSTLKYLYSVEPFKMHFLAKKMLVVVWLAGQTTTNNVATTTLQGKPEAVNAAVSS
jgi:hypothetical protein